MKCTRHAGADQVVHLSSQISTFDVLARLMFSL